MSRTLTKHATDDVKLLLDTLSTASTSAEAYRSAMYKLGAAFAPILAKKAHVSDELIIACTVEDADFLAKGIIDTAEELNFFSSIRLVCFWNTRLSTGDRWTDDSASPIVRRYREPQTEEKRHLFVVVKSIIASGCTVRTNMTNLLSCLDPRDQIIIAAPVLLEDAKADLQKAFLEYFKRFELLSFAIDNETNELGEVIPGIGGNVYKRLGIDKFIVPNIVKNRRQLFAH